MQERYIGEVPDYMDYMTFLACIRYNKLYSNVVQSDIESVKNLVSGMTHLLGEDYLRIRQFRCATGFTSYELVHDSDTVIVKLYK